MVHPRLELREHGQHAVVGRLLDERPPAAAHDLAGHEAEPLQRAGRDQHALGLDVVGVGDPLPQRAVAGRRAVVQGDPAVPLDGPPGALGEVVEREHVRRWDATGEGDDVGRRQQAHSGRVRARGTSRPRPPVAVTSPSAKITSPRLMVSPASRCTSQPS